MTPRRCAVCTALLGSSYDPQPEDVVTITASTTHDGIALTLTATVATCTERHCDTDVATARASATKELARELREACDR